MTVGSAFFKLTAVPISVLYWGVDGNVTSDGGSDDTGSRIWLGDVISITTDSGASCISLNEISSWSTAFEDFIFLKSNKTKIYDFTGVGMLSIVYLLYPHRKTNAHATAIHNTIVAIRPELIWMKPSSAVSKGSCALFVLFTFAMTLHARAMVSVLDLYVTTANRSSYGVMVVWRANVYTGL